MVFPTVQQFQLLDTNSSVLWTIPGPLSADLVVGMIAALQVMTDGYSALVFTSDGNYIISIDHPDRFLSQYLGQRNIPADRVHDYQGPSVGYGWWVQSETPGHYNMYMFPTSDFVQGFISVGDHLNVDFRDYIAGPLFQYDQRQKRNVYHKISGYDIAQFNPLVHRPAAPAPFYTNVNADEADFAARNYV